MTGSDSGLPRLDNSVRDAGRTGSRAPHCVPELLNGRHF